MQVTLIAKVLLSILVISLASLYVADSFAEKSQGTANPVTNSAKVCGITVCSEKMSIQEKIAAYMAEKFSSLEQQGRFQIGGVVQQALKKSSIMVKPILPTDKITERSGPDYKSQKDQVMANSTVSENYIGKMPITAVMNGTWNDPNTWGGRVPSASSDKIIPSGITVTTHAALRNTGTLVIDGNLINNSTFSNTGTIKISNPSGSGISNKLGAFIINKDVGQIAISNSGGVGIDNMGGTVDNSAIIRISNSGGAGISNGGGDIINSGRITNSGIVENNGTLIMSNSGRIINSNTINNFGTIKNSGSIINDVFSTITNYFIMTNDGTILLDIASDTINIGTITLNGTIRSNGNVPNSGTINKVCDAIIDGIIPTSGNPIVDLCS